MCEVYRFGHFTHFYFIYTLPVGGINSYPESNESNDEQYYLNSPPPRRRGIEILYLLNIGIII